jgi:hypothetical protein
MTNMWEGLGPDHTPTAPYPAAGSPGPAWGNGSGGAAGGGGSVGAPSGGGRRRRWTAGLLIAAVAAGGGAFAVAEVTGSPAAATTPVSLSAAPAAQDAAVQSVLSAAVSGHGRLGRLARLRGLGGMYGQFTYETKKGPVTVAFERGTITSVAAGDVVVRAQDGTTQVWDLSSASVVRDHGQRSAASSLAAGELVFAGGPVTNGTRNAALIVIRKAASGSA